MIRSIGWVTSFVLATGGLTGAAGPADAVPPPEETTYRIVEAASGHVLGAVRSGQDPAMTVDAYAGKATQLWRVVDLGEGVSKIVNEGSGKALSTVDGRSDNGAVVHLWNYLGGYPDQHWTVDRADDGTVAIANQGTGRRALSTVGGATAAGTATELWDATPGRAGQRWKLVPTELRQEITVHAGDVVNRVPEATVAVGLEDVNHEIYGGIYSQMVFGEAFAEPAVSPGVSGMWRPYRGGSATAAYALADPFKGPHSQRLTFRGGTGRVGVENRGLNRQGLSVVANRRYEGRITLRSSTRQQVRITFANADGSRTYAATTVVAAGNGWRTYSFELTPSGTDRHARLGIELTRPGTVDLGYVFAQPGAWGRFKGLPVRKDVADKMVDQGLKAIRFGGCANGGCGDVSDYKWKTMIGDPAQRPVTKGFWYPYESNGWGIFEFLQLGEAMGIEAVPSLNIDETPADVADLMDYLYAPASTRWGARRAADGHRAPYRVNRIQLGNEEAVDETYWRKFEALARVIWAHDPGIQLVVGDFTYADVITDPFDFTGGGKISTLAAHQKILRMAQRYGAEVHFDIHLWTQQTDGVRSQLDALDSYVEQLGKLAPGARYKVVVFELNANSHDLTRAVANAYAITALQRRPLVDVVSSANALQVEGHNDNGWNQGLVFMTQDQVWGQPPYYVHTMKAASHRPLAVRADVLGADDRTVEVTAMSDQARRDLTVDVVNASSKPLTYTVTLDGFGRPRGQLQVTTLTGRPSAVNTATNPELVVPETTSRRFEGTTVTHTFPAYSYTSLRFAGGNQ